MDSSWTTIPGEGWSSAPVDVAEEGVAKSMDCGVGDGDCCSVESPQASIASRAKAPTAKLNRFLAAFR